MYGLSIITLYRNVKVMSLLRRTHFGIRARQIDLIAEALQ